METAAAVANRFIDLGWKEPSVPDITQMKLQKLLFYAHAWHLALRDAPLFDDDFEAWPWGPVVRDIYIQTQKFGRQKIADHIKRLQATKDNRIEFVEPEITDLDVRQFVDSVWESHKKFTGIQLSNATHLPGEPWTIVKEHYGSLDSKPTIPNDLIRDVFKKKLTK